MNKKRAYKEKKLYTCLMVVLAFAVSALGGVMYFKYQTATISYAAADYGQKEADRLAQIAELEAAYHTKAVALDTVETSRVAQYAQVSRQYVNVAGGSFTFAR